MRLFAEGEKKRLRLCSLLYDKRVRYEPQTIQAYQTWHMMGQMRETCGNEDFCLGPRPVKPNIDHARRVLLLYVVCCVFFSVHFFPSRSTPPGSRAEPSWVSECGGGKKARS